MRKESIEQQENGKWKVGGLEFSSEEAAKLFADRGRSGATTEADGKHRAWLPVAVLTLVIAGGVWLFVGEKSKSGSGTKHPMDQVAETSEADALFICQQAIKRSSLDAKKTSVPYVRAQGGQDHYFAWNNETKLVMARNGLGLEVGVTASCVVSKYGGRVLSLTIQGQSV